MAITKLEWRDGVEIDYNNNIQYHLFIVFNFFFLFRFFIS